METKTAYSELKKNISFGSCFSSPYRKTGRYGIFLFILLFHLSIPLSLHAAIPIKVGVYQFKPLVFIDQSGEPKGIYIDILQHVSSQKGWQLTYILGSWKECLDRLDKGEIDLLVAIVYTSERDERYDFTREPVLSTWGQVYVQQASEIKGLLDLNNKTVAVQKGDYYYSELARITKELNITCNFIEVNSSYEVFELITQKKADAGVVERLNGLENEKKYRVDRSPIIHSPKALVFATPNNRNPDLIQAIDTYLGKSKKDNLSVYQKSIQNWLGGEIESVLPKWLIWGFGIGGGLLVLFVGASLVLRVQVRAMTNVLSQKNEELQKEIMERKQAEEEILRSKILLESSIESPRDMIILSLDRGYRYLYFNKAHAESMSHVYGTRPQIGDCIFDHMKGKDDIEKVKGNYDRALAGEGHVAIEEYGEDQLRYYYEIRYNPVYDEKNEIIGATAFAEDVTERKKAEEALRESEATLKSIFLAAPTGIGMVADRVIKQVNERFCAMTGYSREELLGKSARMVYPNDEEYEYVGREKYEQISKRGTGTVETRWQRKDGKVIDVLLSSSPIDPNDFSKGVTFTALDITEHKRGEEALRESKDKYRNLVENIHDIIYTTDENGNITYVSPAIKTSIGYDPSEVTGRNFSEFIHKDDLPYVLNRFQKVLSGELQPSEYRLLAKTGEYRWIRSSSSPIFEGDSIVGLRGIFTDITEQKHLEKQLRQSQKMEAIGTLAGGIAHEFNNILAIIISNTEYALKHIPEWNPAKECMTEVNLASLRAKDVIRQILSFSRHTMAERKPIKASSIVHESVSLLRSSIPSSIEIQESISCESDTILADPTQINQVMMNLCTNAYQAMGKEGGTVHVELKNIDIDDDVVQKHPGLFPGKYLQLTVSDTGAGINPDDVGNVFDPYFTTKRLDEGSGLGLWVVHGIVKSYGGEVTITSELEIGTTVSVYLPLIVGEVTAEVDEDKEIPTGDERILLVDDEEMLTRAYTLTLTGLGYNVVSCTNPDEAISIFKEKPESFDLVITDMIMPKMNGDKLAVELKKIRPDIPIILCSGYTEAISDDEAKRIGINAFSMKPIAEKDLADTVRKVLDENSS